MMVASHGFSAASPPSASMTWASNCPTVRETSRRESSQKDDHSAEFILTALIYPLISAAKFQLTR